jgi:alanine racemase
MAPLRTDTRRPGRAAPGPGTETLRSGDAARSESGAAPDSVPSRAEELAAVLRPAWADVDLDALAANHRVLSRRVGEAGLVAVVKADAYGHGAVRVTRKLEALGVAMAAVALLEEGAELRRAGVELPLLALGAAAPVQMPLYRRYRITPTISGLDQLASWREWALGRPREERQPVHLKVDTGMSRLGVAIDEVPEALAALRADPRLELTGLLSHFAEAEDLETARNRRQEERFAEVLELLTETERGRVRIHMANSAAALHRPASRFDLVRLGLALYGLDPAASHPAATEAGAELAPVMSVQARIVTLRDLPAGARVSYGGRWRAPRPSRVAVVPLGYADGYPWRLTRGVEALIAGRRVPVVGAVTMDMTLLDVTAVTDVSVGDEVVLLGRQGGERIGARELAERAGTISYEVLCRLGQRLPRRYFEAGRLTGVASALVPAGGVQ